MQRKRPAVIHMRVQIKGPLHGKSHGFENSGKGSRKGKTGNPKSAKGNQTSKKKRDKEQGRGSLFFRAKGMEVPFFFRLPFSKEKCTDCSLNQTIQKKSDEKQGTEYHRCGF